MAQTVFVGEHELTFPGPHLGVLRDCNAVLDSAEGLHKQIAEDGYLLVRGLIDKEKLIAGRRAILEYANGNGKRRCFQTRHRHNGGDRWCRESRTNDGHTRRYTPSRCPVRFGG